jgi:hypothetical protein
MARRLEAFIDGIIEKPDQIVVVAAIVQQAAGLAMQTQLRPGPCLEQLVHRADATGQRQEHVRQLDHQRFAFGQRLHHVQLTQASVAHFAIQQHLWDDADHPSTGRQGGVRDGAHQPDLAPAVHQGEAPLRDQATGGPGKLQVVRAIARARTAKDTNRASSGLHGAILTGPD